MPPVRLVTVLPGHFHAALIQKEMLSGVERTVHVYAPLDGDLLAHLGQVAGFNARPERPTSWALEVHAGPDYRERFLRERPGTVVVLAGRNRLKIGLMRAAALAGLHVLADKPWIIEGSQFAELEATLAAADRSGVLLHDVMTERHEITSILQRDLVNDPEVFGSIVPGTAESPAVRMESVHYLKKRVAGVPLRRPAWFFDVAEQGEGLADVGTHLVDLVLWMLFSGESIEVRRDVQLVAAHRWPTRLSHDQFQDVTGLSAFPAELHAVRTGGVLDYVCNTQVVYAVRGVYVRLNVLWNYEAPSNGGDAHHAVCCGTRARVEVRQIGGGVPELFVVPGVTVGIDAALRERERRWQSHYPGVEVRPVRDGFHVAIPNALRSGHETHFAEVLGEFLRYLEMPWSCPAWERSHLLAKYWITTSGVEMARQDTRQC